MSTGRRNPQVAPADDPHAGLLGTLLRQSMPPAGDRTKLAGPIAAGVYVPSFEAGHAEHDLTQKIRRGKVSHAVDGEFAALLSATLARVAPGFAPDLVVSVPAKPGQPDHLRGVRREVAGLIGAVDAGLVLRQLWIIDGYRVMPTAERWARSRGRFAATASFAGRSVVLIDDVITSGAQASDAIRALTAAGAGVVRFVAIARATAAPEHRAVDPRFGSLPGRRVGSKP
jgi:hypothetical protein